MTKIGTKTETKTETQTEPKVFGLPRHHNPVRESLLIGDLTSSAIRSL